MVKDYNRDLLWDYLHQLGTATAILTTPLLHVLFSRIHSVLLYSRSTNLALMMIIFIRESNLKCT